MLKSKNERKVSVWNVKLKNGQRIRAATIEQGSRKSSPLCEGCYSKCCRGSIAPILTKGEFFSRKFSFTYMKAPEWLREKAPRADYLITINVGEDGCPYFDQVNLRCELWPNPPQSCLCYDCREDPRLHMKTFAKKREKEWKEKRGK